MRFLALAAAVVSSVVSTAGLAANLTPALLHETLYYKIVSPDGELNCRRGPGSEHAVQRVYSGDALLEAHHNLVFANDTAGNPWLQTMDDCFVRADTRYIMPQSNSPYSREGEINPSFTDINFRWKVVTREDSMGDMRGLNCRVGPGLDYAVRFLTPVGSETSLVGWEIDSRGKVWVALPQGDSEFPACWVRGTRDRLMVLEY